MNPAQLHQEMNRFQHVLSDLSPDVREAIEEHDGRLIAAILDLHRERESLLRQYSALNERSQGSLRYIARLNDLYAEALVRLTAMQAPLATMVHIRSLN